jgi:hypothetical protein
MAKEKFNVLLIASHHGLFVTLKSLEQFKKKIGELIVVIPDDKIEKYSKMDGDEFQNYRELVVKETKKVKKSARIFTASFDVHRRVSQTAEFLSEIDAHGIWLQVCAGSIVNKMPGDNVIPDMKERLLLMSSIRCYDGNRKLDMYMMLQQPNYAVYEKQNSQSFIINADNIPATILPDMFLIKEAIGRNQFQTISPHAFSSQEELVEFAFGGKQLIDHAWRASKCIVADYWSVVMQAKIKIEELYGYPLELYLPHIENCHGLIPAVTIQRIINNATEAKDYSLAFRSALS